MKAIQTDSPAENTLPWGHASHYRITILRRTDLAVNGCFAKEAGLVLDRASDTRRTIV
jgi:hypothetical protein